MNAAFFILLENILNANVMELKEYRKPWCRTVEMAVRESVLLNESEGISIDNWDEQNGEEYDF